jgi:hypothetical protein
MLIGKGVSAYVRQPPKRLPLPADLCCFDLAPPGDILELPRRLPAEADADRVSRFGSDWVFVIYSDTKQTTTPLKWKRQIVLDQLFVISYPIWLHYK